MTEDPAVDEAAAAVLDADDAAQEATVGTVTPALNFFFLDSVRSNDRIFPHFTHKDALLFLSFVSFFLFGNHL